MTKYSIRLVFGIYRVVTAELVVVITINKSYGSARQDSPRGFDRDGTGFAERDNPIELSLKDRPARPVLPFFVGFYSSGSATMPTWPTPAYSMSSTLCGLFVIVAITEPNAQFEGEVDK